MAVNYYAPLGNFRELNITDGGTLTTSGSVLAITGANGIRTFNSTTGTPPTLVNGNTITTSNVTISKVTNGGAITGIIMQAGTTDNQVCIVQNQGSGTITFAAAGTSNVAGGTAIVIAALKGVMFTWDATSALWY